MKIEHPSPDTIRVSDLAPGDVFELGGSFYIVTDEGPVSDRICINLETGFSLAYNDESVSHIPDATFLPHGRASSES